MFCLCVFDFFARKFISTYYWLMRYHIITIFPEIFDSFIDTSLLAKAREKQLIDFFFINPRDFCTDRQRQIDDQIYGGGAWLLMKAPPIIAAIQAVRTWLDDSARMGVVLPSPSSTYFDQELTHTLTDSYTDLVFVCGRYEWIDHRVELWCQQEFGQHFYKVSLGKFVTLGGEVPSMVMIEAISRLIPWVIKEQISRQDESYRPEQGGENIEYPQYTRPEEVEGMRVPDILLSGHHAQIAARRRQQ